MKSLFTPLILLISLMLSGLSHGQTPEFAILSFNRVGSLIYISATAEGQSGAFLVDTGYRGVLLNKAYFTGVKTDRFLQGTNGKGGDLQAKKIELCLGLLNIEKLDAEIGDLSHLENSVGIPLLGMIGSTFFEDFETIIDYTTNSLTLIRLNKFGERTVDLPTLGPPSDTISFCLKGHLPIIEAQLGPNRLKLAIDTGASSNLFRSNIFSKLKNWIWGLQKIYLKGLGAGRRKAKAAMVSRVSVDGISFPAMRTLFANIGHINRDLAGPNLDGIVGYEFLSRYRMGLNYKKQELYVWQSTESAPGERVEYTARAEE